MPLSIAQLRSVARGEQSLESVKLLEDCSGRIMTLEETASVFALNEAYFGRKPVEKIQKAMDKIYRLARKRRPSRKLFATFSVLKAAASTGRILPVLGWVRRARARGLRQGSLTLEIPVLHMGQTPTDFMIRTM